MRHLFFLGFISLPPFFSSVSLFYLFFFFFSNFSLHFLILCQLLNFSDPNLRFFPAFTPPILFSPSCPWWGGSRCLYGIGAAVVFKPNQTRPGGAEMGHGPCFVSRQRLRALIPDLRRCCCFSCCGQQAGNCLSPSHCIHRQIIYCLCFIPTSKHGVEALAGAVGLICSPELFAFPAQCTSGVPQLPVLWWQQQQLLLCLCTDRKRALELQVSFISHLIVRFKT